MLQPACSKMTPYRAPGQQVYDPTVTTEYNEARCFSPATFVWPSYVPHTRARAHAHTHTHAHHTHALNQSLNHSTVTQSLTLTQTHLHTNMEMPMFSKSWVNKRQTAIFVHSNKRGIHNYQGLDCKTSNRTNCYEG